MLGAIIGDIVGSRFEFNNHRSKDFDLFTNDCFVTDDSIMTLSVAKAIMETEKCIEPSISDNDFDIEYHLLLGKHTIEYMQKIGRKYPNCGYGGMFNQWIFSNNPEPYSSFGNGAAMRISPAGFAARSESEAISLAETITKITHNHKEGIKGARATAVAINMARQGCIKSEIRQKITNDYYSLGFTIDEIRPTYKFNETCQETVPQAIECFLESDSFEDAIRTAISLGGDSDTIAAISGAIAEAYYGIPDDIRSKALSYLDDDLRTIYAEWEIFLGKDNSSYKFLTRYIGKLSAALSFGERVVDHENDGTPEHPWQWPYTSYSDLVSSFRQDFYQFSEVHPEYSLTSYSKTLEQHGINWSYDEMRDANVDKLDALCTLALIMGAMRGDYFCEGALLDFFEDGSILKWLKHLKDIDNQEPGKKLSEVVLELGGFGGIDYYSLLFSDRRAFLKSGRFQESRPMKRCSTRETEKLIADWGNIHTEYWKFSYQQDQDMLICDGTQWSLFVRYEGTRGIMYNGDNTYPESWDALLAFFGIEIDDEDDFDNEQHERKPGEVIYCKVRFSEDTTTYYYQTEDDSIQVGDHVIVPVGSDNVAREAVVNDVEFYTPKNVPYPLAQTKHITGRRN